MENKADLRVKRTRAAIKTAFEELVVEVGLDKITVASLTERAGINRKTFYLHYETIEDLFDETVNAILDDYFENYETTPDKPEDIAGHATRFFLFLANQPELTEKLICSSNRFYYGEKIYRLQMARYARAGYPLKDMPAGGEELILNFTRTTAREFYRRWVRQGKILPAEQAAQLLADLTCNGLSNFLLDTPLPARALTDPNVPLSID